MSNVFRSFFRFQEGGLLIVILVLGILLTVFSGSVRLPKFAVNAEGQRTRVFVTNEKGERSPAFEEKNKFLNAQNLAKLAKDTSFIAIMAVGMAIVIIAGGIDLSVGAIYALASVLGALVFQHFGTSGGLGGILAGIGVTAGVGALCGLVNGGLIVVLNVHPFIITLGTMAILRGIAFVATQGQSIGGFPEGFRNLVRFEVGNGLSLVPLVVMLVVTLLGWLYLSRFAVGRRVYAVGGNETAARYSGLNVKRVKLGIYILSGLGAGISALVALGYYGAATSGDGTGYELSVIAAAVVGGCSLTGGRGSALGVVLGALIIQIIASGIDILGINQSYSQIITGSVVIIAVVLDGINTAFAKRRLAAKVR